MDFHPTTNPRRGPGALLPPKHLCAKDTFMAQPLSDVDAKATLSSNEVQRCISSTGTGPGTTRAFNVGEGDKFARRGLISFCVSCSRREVLREIAIKEARSCDSDSK